MQVCTGQTLRLFLLGIVCLALTACERPHAVYWSPDGQRGVWAGSQGDHTLLIDATGKILADYGKSAGFAAWAPDGQTAYIANHSHEGVQSIWETELPGIINDTFQPIHWDDISAIVAAHNKDSEVLVHVQGQVVEMQISPDGNWLVAALHIKNPNTTEHYNLVALYLKDKEIRQVIASNVGAAFAFTGPHRLAFTKEPNAPRVILPEGVVTSSPIQSDAESDAKVGKLVEVTLDSSAKSYSPANLLDILVTETPYLQAVGEDIVFSSIARSLPGSPVSTDPPLFKIYYYSRDDKGLSVIADSTGPFFQIDPSGKQILFQKIIPATKSLEARHEIAVMNINGSSSNTLWSFNPDSQQIGCIPTWQDSEHISYISADPSTDQADPANLTTHDLTLYQIDPAGRPRAVRNLSQTWSTNLKPTINQPAPIAPIASTAPVTQPSTQPATQRATQPATSQPASTQESPALPASSQPVALPAASLPATSPSSTSSPTTTRPTVLPTTAPASQPATLPDRADTIPATSEPAIAPLTAPIISAPAIPTPVPAAPATMPAERPSTLPMPLPATMPTTIPATTKPA